jgi:hypothetical protein
VQGALRENKIAVPILLYRTLLHKFFAIGRAKISQNVFPPAKAIQDVAKSGRGSPAAAFVCLRSVNHGQA